MAEDEVPDPLAPDHADELPQGAGDEDQHDEPEPGPEGGPHDLLEELRLGRPEAPKVEAVPLAQHRGAGEEHDAERDERKMGGGSTSKNSCWIVLQTLLT